MGKHCLAVRLHTVRSGSRALAVALGMVLLAASAHASYRSQYQQYVAPCVQMIDRLASDLERAKLPGDPTAFDINPGVYVGTGGPLYNMDRYASLESAKAQVVSTLKQLLPFYGTVRGWLWKGTQADADRARQALAEAGISANGLNLSASGLDQGVHVDNTINAIKTAIARNDGKGCWSLRWLDNAKMWIEDFPKIVKFADEMAGGAAQGGDGPIAPAMTNHTIEFGRTDGGPSEYGGMVPLPSRLEYPAPGSWVQTNTELGNNMKELLGGDRDKIENIGNDLADPDAPTSEAPATTDADTKAVENALAGKDGESSDYTGLLEPPAPEGGEKAGAEGKLTRFEGLDAQLEAVLAEAEDPANAGKGPPWGKYEYTDPVTGQAKTRYLYQGDAAQGDYTAVAGGETGTGAGGNVNPGGGEGQTDVPAPQVAGDPGESTAPAVPEGETPGVTTPPGEAGTATTTAPTAQDGQPAGGTGAPAGTRTQPSGGNSFEDTGGGGATATSPATGGAAAPEPPTLSRFSPMERQLEGSLANLEPANAARGEDPWGKYEFTDPATGARKERYLYSDDSVTTPDNTRMVGPGETLEKVRREITAREAAQAAARNAAGPAGGYSYYPNPYAIMPSAGTQPGSDNAPPMAQMTPDQAWSYYKEHRTPSPLQYPRWGFKAAKGYLWAAGSDAFYTVFHTGEAIQNKWEGKPNPSELEKFKKEDYYWLKLQAEGQKWGYMRQDAAWMLDQLFTF